MANITIVKLKVRRGSDAQRKTIVLDQGEVGYTLDTNRLFIGDGSTYGGRSVGGKNIGPFAAASNLGPDSSPGMQVGDIGYANSKLYMLTATNYNDSLSGYAYIGTIPDNDTLEFDSDNQLQVKKKQFINAEYFDSIFFGDGLLSGADGIPGQISVNLNTEYLELSGPSAAITPKINSITEREIASTALSSGLIGGNDTPLKLKINNDQFEFNVDHQLTIKSLGDIDLPATTWAGGGDSGRPSNLIDSGLSLNSVTGKLQANLRSVDVNTFSLNTETGKISLYGASDQDIENPYLETTNGLIKQFSSSIFDVVTGLELSGSNTGNSIPVGTILPHARAWSGTVPAGFLLANGRSMIQADYAELYNVIGDNYGTGDGSGLTFSLPNLTGGGMPPALYGYDALAPNPDDFASGTQKFITGDTGSAGAILSGFGVNFIIKYENDPLLNIFNGAPDSVSIEAVGRNNNQVYHGVDSNGAAVSLSSAGFIRFALGGDVRDPDSNGKFDKYAVPIFNY